MANVYRTDPRTVQDNETIQINTEAGAPGAAAILGARIRWRGVSEQERHTSSNSDTSITASGLNGYSVSRSVTFPSVPAGYSFYRHYVRDYYQSQTDGSRTYVEIDWGSPVNNTSTRSTQTGDRYVSATHSYSSTNRVGTSATARFTHTDGAGFRGYVRAYTEGERYESVPTDAPAVTVNNDDSVFYSGSLSNGEWSAWYPLPSFVVGYNELDHSIGGSEQAEIEIEYEYAMPLDSPVVTYPNGGETVTGVQSITWKLPAGEDSSVLQSEIEVSTDAGDTWNSIISATDPGATAYDFDFSQIKNTSFGRVRVRVHDGEVASAWDESNGIFSIQDNRPPDRASQLEPSGGDPVNYRETIRLSWQFNDEDEGDAQTAFDLRWREEGAAEWQVVNRTTSTPHYDIAGNTFPVGVAIEWQVRTYDQRGEASAWSDTAIFYSSEAPPRPTWQTPQPGGTINVARPILSWESSRQAAYRLWIEDTAGSIVYETEQTTTNQAVELDAELQNDTAYTFHLQIQNDDGLWSNPAEIAVEVSFTPPARPLVQLEPSSNSAAVVVRVDNPAPSSTQPTVENNRIYRRERGRDEWVLLATDHPPNMIFSDDTPASGTFYEYKVRGVGENGTYTDSDTVSTKVEFIGVWLTNSLDPSEIYHFLYVQDGRSSETEWEGNLAAYDGRRWPVAHFTDRETKQINVTLQLFRDSGDLEKLERLLKKRVPFLYRDARGRHAYGVVFSYQINESIYGYTVPLDIHVVQHEEGF